MTAATSLHPLSTRSFLHGVLGWVGVTEGARVLTGGRGEGYPAVSKVLSGATPGLFKKTSPSTFFTMLTFSKILNIYLQWMTALSPAIVCKVESERPTYGKSSCQYKHDMAPRCTLIIPHRLSIMAQFSCQSQCVIWRGVSEGLRLV